MFSKSLIAAIFLIASISSANAHAGLSPALGVKGQLTRNDVQRPSANSPCGNVNIPQNLDTSTPIQADATGNFSPTIQDFNAGADGSTSVKTVQVDASGTGKNFVVAKMVVNGDAAPPNVESKKLTVQLPAGTKCAGGAKKNLCLASFTTTAGFGNCVVVSQGAGASNTPASRSMSGQSITIRNGAAKGANSSTSLHTADGAETSQKAKNADGKKGKDDKKGKDLAAGKGKDDKKGKDGKKGKDLAAGKGKDDKKGKDGKKGKDLAAGKGKDDKKGKGAKKGKDDKKGKDLAANKGKVDKKGKDGKKGKDDGKKKGDKKNVKQANKKAPAGADGSNRRRSWSSRQMGNFA